MEEKLLLEKSNEEGFEVRYPGGVEAVRCPDGSVYHRWFCNYCKAEGEGLNYENTHYWLKEHLKKCTGVPGTD